ncbi:hypothetical protein [Desulfoluna spongiiphila]|uniref:Porin n=1 Tax=Desulfoluna spongiiphila TaxID=419481 RepID=A0A1G5GS82_9BACT|nr:hypothetical protein [Desulfoluna spongiiphila]SCY53498.1 hypothetical protein SAMN05216233_11151 [Desulfoluna spongiiphila]
MFKKVFAAMLAGLFISAPAFAEVKMNGSFFIKGHANQSKDGNDYSYYESDFEVKTDFIVNENTSAKLVVEAFDEDWVSSPKANAYKNDFDAQNSLQVTTATMTHKFATDTTFTGGVAPNRDSWGTLFGDNADKNYFVQVEQALPFGTLVLKNEKIEEGLTTDDDLDQDGYLLGFTANAGDLSIMPAIYYNDDQKNDKEEARFMVAVTGKLGAISIESEFGYADFSNDNDNKAEGSVFGAWVDAGTTVGGLSVNLGILYAGADDKSVYVVGDELAPMDILGDDVTLDGSSLVRVKLGKTITEKVSVDTSLAYAFTNVDKDYIGEDDPTFGTAYYYDSVYELDVNAYYKASDAVTLSTGVAYLDGDNADESSFEDARYDAYAKINVAF